MEYGGPGAWDAYHEECGSRWYDGITIVDVFCAGAGKADGDDGIEAEYFADKGCDVWYLFFGKAFLPSIAIRVEFHDLFIRSFLDPLTVRGGEIGDTHDEITGYCVEAR